MMRFYSALFLFYNIVCLFGAKVFFSRTRILQKELLPLLRAEQSSPLMEKVNSGIKTFYIINYSVCITFVTIITVMQFQTGLAYDSGFVEITPEVKIIVIVFSICFNSWYCLLYSMPYLKVGIKPHSFL
eukprot:TRINITY_DN23270_c0_g1_i1.p1 TRINITY_DN23270_c0_g1~~TRINITY_DN23270_c0_g1_i1.p1  ORF type:complete len:129 (-),score=24.23 TRINITY_DN23270_c0_g1_i1:245-631(-)